jgi:hypothetical protein
MSNFVSFDIVVCFLDCQIYSLCYAKILYTLNPTIAFVVGESTVFYEFVFLHI